MWNNGSNATRNSFQNYAQSQQQQQQQQQMQRHPQPNNHIQYQNQQQLHQQRIQPPLPTNQNQQFMRNNMQDMAYSVFPTGNVQNALPSNYATNILQPTPQPAYQLNIFQQMQQYTDNAVAKAVKEINAKNQSNTIKQQKKADIVLQTKAVQPQIQCMFCRIFLFLCYSLTHLCIQHLHWIDIREFILVILWIQGAVCSNL